MKLTVYFKCIVLIFVIVFLHGYAIADVQSDISKILAEVQFKRWNIDKDVYHQIDMIVPELKKIAKDKIIKLECRYSGQPDREKDVENAYKLAAKIEKYLRVRHKLDLDMWVAIDIAPRSSKISPVLTIAVFSDDIKRLDSVQVDPLKNELK